MHIERAVGATAGLLWVLCALVVDSCFEMELKHQEKHVTPR